MDDWEIFARSGSVEDYLRYRGLRAVRSRPAGSDKKHADHSDGHRHPGTERGGTGQVY
ncbi:hypothetical protein [Ruminococcus sp.]|uniref:hypothetical protein n=1 Tax=Ruminococcus sp. TaxID=41978 RepID=UPI0025DB50E2|nr:hypothetical protein [Ruminococcus sp.]MCI5816999.1 hypothetical protein [Ruminococcus sp.]